MEILFGNHLVIESFFFFFYCCNRFIPLEHFSFFLVSRSFSLFYFYIFLLAGEWGNDCGRGESGGTKCMKVYGKY